jgi:hypothetical protein
MVFTYKQKFNKKYGFEKDESHSLKEIAKITGYKESGLEKILAKGSAAFYSAPSSVRPNVKSAEQWKFARLYSAVMGGKAAKIDASHLIR